MVEDYTPRYHKVDKQWIPELGLKQTDRKVLLHRNSWLTDNIIDAAQKLLKKANPAVPGLQDVGCGLTMNFAVQPGEFVQILHTGQGHWNTVSTIGTSHPEVQIFDSMFITLPIMGKAQIAALLATNEWMVTVKFMDVQMQCGESDCGLFAIAFATALVFGEQPGHFSFDQKKMRSHLMHCFEQQQMSMFPIRKRRRIHSKVKTTENIPIYCVCRMPQLPNTNWVECSRCKEWYHSDTCVQLLPVI